MSVQMRRMQNVLDDLVQRTSPPPVQARRAEGIMLDVPDRSAAAEYSPTESLLQHSGPHESSSSTIRGPTSPGFTFDVVKRSFRERGFDTHCVNETLEEDHVGQHQSITRPRETFELSPALRTVLKDPVWEMSGATAIKLIKLFASGPGLMYPVVDIEDLITEATTLFATIENIRMNGRAGNDDIHIETLLNHDLTDLKLVLAISIVLEKKDADKLAERLLHSMQDDLWISTWQASTLKTLTHVILLVSLTTTFLN